MQKSNNFRFFNFVYNSFFAHAKIIPAFVIILLVNILLFSVFSSHIFLFVDTSREVYIPMAMNSGEVLYKDIFNVYPPLGYQFNAFLTSVFGLNFHTFFISGFINSTLILFGLYLILRLFLKKSFPFIILSVLFLINVSCVYAISHTNYIFPYSYSMIYALNAFIWSLVCLLYFLKKKKYSCLYLSFLLYGLSISFKYEFVLFFFILFSILIFKKEKIKIYIYSFINMFIFPLWSFILLKLNGVSLIDIKTSAFYIHSLLNSKYVNILYTYLGFIPTFSSLKIIFISFIKFIAIFILFFFFYVVLFYLFNKKQESDNLVVKKINYFIIILFLLPCIVTSFYLSSIFIKTNAFVFNWIGILSVLVFIYFAFIFTKKYKDNSLCNNDKLFFILFIAVPICSYKAIFNISFNSYGSYYFPLLFICIIVFLLKYTPFSEKKSQIIITLFIICLASSYLYSNIIRQSLVFDEQKVNINNKGNIYIEKSQKTAFTELLNYINNNTNPENSIVAMPEGSMINFLSGRKSDDMYYYLIPPNIEIFGEDKITDDLKSDLPDYIVLSPLSYTNFNETYFCGSFGNKICSLLTEYYDNPVVFGDDFWLAIYKRKL